MTVREKSPDHWPSRIQSWVYLSIMCQIWTIAPSVSCLLIQEDYLNGLQINIELIGQWFVRWLLFMLNDIKNNLKIISQYKLIYPHQISNSRYVVNNTLSQDYRVSFSVHSVVLSLYFKNSKPTILHHVKWCCSLIWLALPLEWDGPWSQKNYPLHWAGQHASSCIADFQWVVSRL